MLEKDTLVTGATGLVGSSFEGLHHKVSSKDADLRDKNQIHRYFIKHPTIKKVIHCAGKVGGVFENDSKKGEFFYDNIMINTNLIETCRIYHIEKMVCFLSTCVFPDDCKYPLTIDQIHKGEPHHTNYAYAYAKRMVDIQIRAYREQYGLKYVSVIPCNIYGVNDNFNLHSAHVIPALIHKCYLAKKNNTFFGVCGNGEPLREFMFSEDVSKLTEWILNNYDDSEPIILSTSEEIPLKDVVNMIVKEIGFDGEVRYSGNETGQLRKPSDNTKIKELLPNFRFTPIEEGIKKTVNWVCNNYSHIRK